MKINCPYCKHIIFLTRDHVIINCPDCGKEINVPQCQLNEHKNQLDQLYKRVHALEHKSPVPLYEEKPAGGLNMHTGEWIPSGETEILISGKSLSLYSKWELAQIIKRQAEQLENVWNQ